MFLAKRYSLSCEAGVFLSSQSFVFSGFSRVQPDKRTHDPVPSDCRIRPYSCSAKCNVSIDLSLGHTAVGSSLVRGLSSTALLLTPSTQRSSSDCSLTSGHKVKGRPVASQHPSIPPYQSNRKQWQQNSRYGAAKRSPNDQPRGDKALHNVKDVFKRWSPSSEKTSSIVLKSGTTAAEVAQKERLARTLMVDLRAIYAVLHELHEKPSCPADFIMSHRKDIEASLPYVTSPGMLQTLVRACVATKNTQSDMREFVLQLLDRFGSLPVDNLSAHQRVLFWLIHWCSAGRLTTTTLETAIIDSIDVKGGSNLNSLISFAYSMTLLNIPSWRLAYELVHNPILLDGKSPQHHLLLVNALQYAVLSGVSCSHLLQSGTDIEAFMNDMSNMHSQVHRLLPFLDGTCPFNQEHLNSLRRSAYRRAKHQPYMMSLELSAAARSHLCSEVGEENIGGQCHIGGVAASALVIASGTKLIPKDQWPESFLEGNAMNAAAILEAGYQPIAVAVCPKTNFLVQPRHRPTGHTTLEAMYLQQQKCLFAPVVFESGRKNEASEDGTSKDAECKPVFRPVPQIAKSYPHHIEPFKSWVGNSL